MNASMKNIDKVKLGERLLKYFKKQGCEVQVIKAPYSSISDVPTVNVFKISPRECNMRAFQKLTYVWTYTSHSTNASWDSFMKDITNEYCNCRMSSSTEFISAHSPEELDIKLSIRGF